MTSTPLKSSGRPRWPSGSLSRSGVSVLSALSFLTLLGRPMTSWTPPGMAVSLPGLSRALLGGTYSFVLSILEHVLTRFTASSAHHQHPRRVLMFPIRVRHRWEMFHWSSPMVSSPPQAQLWGSFGAFAGLSGGGDGSGGCISTSLTSVEVR